MGETAPAYSTASRQGTSHKSSRGNGNGNGGLDEADLLSLDSSLATREDDSVLRPLRGDSPVIVGDASVMTDAVPADRNLPSSSPSSKPGSASSRVRPTSTPPVAPASRLPTIPTLTSDDYERIFALWQGESNVCKLFQFACQTISLEDAQHVVQAEQTVFEQLQLAQETEMTMLEDNDRRLLEQEETTERAWAEQERARKLEEEAAVAAALAAAEAKKAANTDEGDEDDKDGNGDDEAAVDVDADVDADVDVDVDVDVNRQNAELTPTEIEAVEVGQRRPPPGPEDAIPEASSAPEWAQEPNNDDHDEDDDVVEFDADGHRIVHDNATGARIDYATKKEAKRLYPDLMDTGGAVRLVLLRRALETERLLLRESHVQELAVALKRLEDAQATVTTMEQSYTTTMDTMIDWLASSFPSLQNTQQLLYQFLHAPVSVLFPATSSQTERFQLAREKRRTTVGGGGGDDEMEDEDAAGGGDGNEDNADDDEEARGGLPHTEDDAVSARLRRQFHVTAHTIDDWMGLLQCFARLMKRDFDQLQRLRYVVVRCALCAALNVSFLGWFLSVDLICCDA